MRSLSVHLVTDAFPPTRGGLEAWTGAMASWLSSWCDVTVYVLGDKAEETHRGRVEHSGRFEVLMLEELRRNALDPVSASEFSDSRKRKEYERATYLSLLTAIEVRTTAKSENKHVIISNFVLSAGFFSMTVAETIGIDHVVRIAGTDWSRGLRTCSERAILKDVLKQATVVVALNSEQHKMASSIARGGDVKLIRNSVRTMPPLYVRPRLESSTIELFSDCGFSHKKATNILIYAYLNFASATHLDVRLTVVGGDEQGQEEYWKNLRRRVCEKLRDRIRFSGHVSPDEIAKYLSHSDLYCSATLAEGCSSARSAALCAGIPIVSTRSGEMRDIGEKMSHVLLVAPGDIDSFQDALSQFIHRINRRDMIVDRISVLKAREQFDLERERSAWCDLLGGLQ